MRTFHARIFVAAALATAILAAPGLEARKCSIACLEPMKYDPLSQASCNCDEIYCPAPADAIIPAGEVWGWNKDTNSCGAVSSQDQCTGPDVTCVSGYHYGWNGIDTCQCVLDKAQRDIELKRDNVVTGDHISCLIPCFPPTSHDDYAKPTSCNCEKRTCPAPKGVTRPSGETWAYNAATKDCGFVEYPFIECGKANVTCIDDYTYTWNANVTACECQKVVSPLAVCLFECIPPASNDPNAKPPNCNCDKKTCLKPEDAIIPSGKTYAYDAKSRICGSVDDASAECKKVGVECVKGTYDWDSQSSSCQCI